MPVRVVLGEDDVLLREEIARNLEGAGLEVVAQAGSADTPCTPPQAVALSPIRDWLVPIARHRADHRRSQ
jgi:hypothetical protein